jgi:hypothetical protein
MANSSETQTEFLTIEHDELAVLAGKYLKKSRCPIVLVKNQLMYSQEQPDVIAFGLLYPMVVVVEVKTSRADFKKDQLKPFRTSPEKGMGSSRYYCCPDGLIKPEELPPLWGLLYYRNGKIEQIVRSGLFKNHNHLAERYLLLYYLKHPEVYEANKI